MPQTNNSLKKDTLLYLASGPYHKDYENLPYSKVILVDRGCKSGIPENLTNSKVEFWKMDALEAIDEIEKRKLTIDCLVSVNEGLWQGGGTYPIFSEFLLGYISPHLAKELLVITNLDYYGAARIKTRVSKMDWSYQKLKRLKELDLDYVNPSIFSGERRCLGKENQFGYGHVFHLKKIELAVTGTLGSVKIAVIHGSIWNDKSSLDAIGLSLNLKTNVGSGYFGMAEKKFFETKKNIFSIRGLTIHEIIEHCKKNNIKRLGITPWLHGQYKEVVDALSNYKDKIDLKIYFYYLNEKDFKDIKSVLTDYYIKTYPDYFSALSNEDIEQFQEVLFNGHNDLIYLLCQQIRKHQKSRKIKMPFSFKQIKIEQVALKLYYETKDKKIMEIIKIALTTK